MLNEFLSESIEHSTSDIQHSRSPVLAFALLRRPLHDRRNDRDSRRLDRSRLSEPLIAVIPAAPTDKDESDRAPSPPTGTAREAAPSRRYNAANMVAVAGSPVNEVRMSSNVQPASTARTIARSTSVPRDRRPRISPAVTASPRTRPGRSRVGRRGGDPTRRTPPAAHGARA